MAERKDGSLPRVAAEGAAREDVCAGQAFAARAAGAPRARRTGRRFNLMPGIPVATVGFACTLLAMEGFRLSSVFRVGDLLSSTSLIGAVVSLVVLTLVALAYKRLKGALRLPVAFIVVAGAVYSLLLVMSMGQSEVGAPAWLEIVCRCALDILPVLFMYFWMVELFAFGAAAVCNVCGFSLLVLALLNCLTAFLKPDAAMMLVAVMPVISAGLLAFFRENARARCLYPTDTTSAQANGNRFAEEGIPYDNQVTGVAFPDYSLIVPPDRERGGRLFFLITLMISMVCFAVLFGQVHSLWVLLQDNGTMSLLVQMGAATGTAVAGVVALVFVRYLWNRRCLELLKLLLLGTVLISLWLSSFSEGLWVFSYLVFLNITQKLVMVLIMLSPYLVMEKSRYLWPWWLTCLSFEVGKGLSQCFIGNPEGGLFMVGAVLPLGVLFVCTAATAFLGDSRHGAAPGEPAEAVRGGGACGGSGPEGAGAGGKGAGAEAGSYGVDAAGVTGEDFGSENAGTEGVGAEGRRADTGALDAAGAEAGELGVPVANVVAAPEHARMNRLRTACNRVAAEYGLTARESEILLLLARGRTAATIAETLVITPSTAKTHLRNIYAKLDVHTQQELINLVEAWID
ncbi:helix-turn-helix transcriptional regulator [Parvibacter caecicola]|uniref:helix-turn-helix transcriptional regulator n=1 Tax=Parvibacter caecicola TaxID=747645 RepID=UPI00249C6027|nr:helix-turn-helix transcriptional regulator [Parvibacter caecicola]